MHFSDFNENNLLEIILDSISAREINGVYIVIEQSLEVSENRQCTNNRTLESLLHLVHKFSFDCGLQVGVNFVGAFGFICRAAGATFWCSEWYKSLYRLRLADKPAQGRAYPSLWSFPALMDINMDGDFDEIVKLGFLQTVAEKNSASKGLILACSSGKSSNNVVEWKYNQSNVEAAREHFIRCSIDWENKFPQNGSHINKRNFIYNLLKNATILNKDLEKKGFSFNKTKYKHINSWMSAFRKYRNFHPAN